MTSGTPRMIGRYEVLDSVGEGGMGVVYRARDPRIGRVVAIKLLRIDSHDLRMRFEREARSVGNLTQANIVTIFDFGEHDGRPFIVMEYVQGETLAHQIGIRARLTLAVKLDLIDMLANGLGYAHSQGIIHRDIKPANLMIDRHGVLKILDFGIARVEEGGGTQAGMMVGTPNYMSPEQVEGRSLDPRSDIFAVGAVFYELLSYRLAFPGESVHGILDRVLHAQPEPLAVACPGLDPSVQIIVAKALEKNLADRYQTLGQLRLDLARCRARLASVDESGANETIAGSISQAPPVRTPRAGTSREQLSRRRADQIQAHLKTATDALDGGDYHGAIAACEQAGVLDPDEPRMLECLERAREGLDRQRLEELLGRAELSHQRGEFDSAADLVAEALHIDPGSIRAARLNQAVADGRERDRQAREARRRVDALMQSSRLSVSSQSWDEALRSANDALALDPQNIEAQEISRRAAVAIEERRVRDEHERQERERRERAAAEAEQLRQVHERWLAERLATAQKAIDAHRFDHAIETLEQVLRVKPHTAAATALLEAARRSQAKLVAEANRADENVEHTPADQGLKAAPTTAAVPVPQPLSRKPLGMYAAVAVVAIATAITVTMLMRARSGDTPAPPESPSTVGVQPDRPGGSQPGPSSPPVPAPEQPAAPLDSRPSRGPDAKAGPPSQEIPSASGRPREAPARPDVDSLIASGFERFGQGAYDQALAMFRNALAADPGNRRAQDGINRVTAAKAMEQQVLRNSAETAAELASAEEAFRQGQYDRAILAFQGVLRLDSTNAAAQAGVQKAQRAKAAEEQILRKKQDR